MRVFNEYNIGDYFIVTSGYCKDGGLVNPAREALLFLAVEGDLYRKASREEIKKYIDLHPILATG